VTGKPLKHLSYLITPKCFDLKKVIVREYLLPQPNTGSGHSIRSVRQLAMQRSVGILYNF
jgi:hypothetical protein